MKVSIVGKCVVIEGDVIETARLILRRFTPDDLPSLTEIYADDEVRRYIDIGQPEAPADIAAERRLALNLERYETFGFGQYAVLERARGELIGWCGFAYTHGLSAGGDVEIAYGIRREFWQGGYATEAAGGALRYGFEHLGFEQIVGVTLEGNRASRRVLEKLGFDRVGETFYYDERVTLYRLKRDAFISRDETNEVLHTTTSDTTP